MTRSSSVVWLRRLRARLLAPVLASLEELQADSRALRKIAGIALQSRLRQEAEGIKMQIRARTPTNPVLWGQKVYAQTDEDGILAEIVRRLPDGLAAGRTVIEIGCGNGTENNSHNLLLQGWRGVWCDGSSAHVAAIERGLGGLRFPRLWVCQRFLTAGNIEAFIRDATAFLGTTEPTVLSLDVDGNDLALLRGALHVCQPHVVCVEIGAAFPPPIALTMAYRPDHVWAEDDYQGSSLQAFVEALRPAYLLVTCNLSGANAFFVRRDCAAEFEEYAVGDLYQPPRYHLIYLAAGHRPTLKWLRQILNEA
jgi:hypothetical protein